MQIEKGKNQYCVQNHQNLNWEENIPEWTEGFFQIPDSVQQ